MQKVSLVDMDFLDPFIEGTIKTFKVQCGIECLAGKPIKVSNPLDYPVAITGGVSVSSPLFVGKISIHFPQEIFLSLMSNMLEESFHEINEELEDGAGELINIIFGHAKIVLNQKGHSFDKALPEVIRGNMLNPDALVIPFETKVGSFYFEIIDES